MTTTSPSRGAPREGLTEDGAPPLVGLRLRLLDGFELCWNDEEVELTVCGQRLIAFLALHERPVRRSFVAGTLWIDTSEERAAANLRSTIWRLAPPARQAVAARGNLLSLAPGVEVDLRQVGATARRLINDDGSPTGDAGANAAAAALLSLELLPDWYDDWVLLERERQRHMRLRALEALCSRLTAMRQFGAAIEAGLAAVTAEPLRESAHRVLISAHLAEGNYGEAIRQYEVYARLIAEELNLRPSPAMNALVNDVWLEAPDGASRAAPSNGPCATRR